MRAMFCTEIPRVSCSTMKSYSDDAPVRREVASEPAADGRDTLAVMRLARLGWR